MGERTSEVVRRTASDGDDEPDVTTETVALRGDIEQTRAEMSETIDAIQDKLDPETLSEQAKDTAQEVADRAIAQAKEAVQEVADRAIPQAKEAVQAVADHAIAQAKEAVREVTGQAGAALRGATIGKVEDMARYASDTAGGWRHTLVATVKAHPIPSALAGLTLGYLFLNRESGPDRPARYGGNGATDYRGTNYRDAGYRTPGYESGRAYGGYDAGRGYEGTRGYDAGSSGPSVTERAGDMAGQARDTAAHVADQAQERAGQAMDKVQDTAGQVVDQVQETAGQVVDQVQEQAHRAQSFLGRQLDENPLAVGAVAVLLGGALASLAGTTPREDRMFGETRDRLMGRAGEMTQETLEKVEGKVEQVVGEVKETAGRAAEEIKSTATREARAQDLLPETAGSGSSSGAPASSSRAGAASGTGGTGVGGASGSRPPGATSAPGTPGSRPPGVPASGPS